jgi:hypothetical protein
MVVTPSTIHFGISGCITMRDWYFGNDGGIFAFGTLLPNIQMARRVKASIVGEMHMAVVDGQYLDLGRCAEIMGSARADDPLEVARDLMWRMVIAFVKLFPAEAHRVASSSTRELITRDAARGTWTYAIPLRVVFGEDPAPVVPYVPPVRTSTAVTTAVETRHASPGVRNRVGHGEARAHVDKGPDIEARGAEGDRRETERLLKDKFGLDDAGVEGVKCDGFFRWSAIWKIARVGNYNFKKFKSTKRYIHRVARFERADPCAMVGAAHMLSPKVALEALRMCEKL